MHFLKEFNSTIFQKELQLFHKKTKAWHQHAFMDDDRTTIAKTMFRNNEGTKAW